MISNAIAWDRLEQLFEKHQFVVLTGGSGLYIKALCEGMNIFPEVPESIKAAVEKIFYEKGISALQEELHLADPTYHAQVDLNNPHRLMRAISVCRSSGRPFSSFHQQEKKERGFTPIYLQMYWPRSQLYERINARVENMIDKGLLQEVQRLFPFRQLNALQTVGYQELFTHLEGEVSLEEAIALIKRNTRRYAKRQSTWTRRDGFWKLIRPEELEVALQYIDLVQKQHLQIQKFIRPEDLIFQKFIAQQKINIDFHWKDQFVGLLQKIELIGIIQLKESKLKVTLSNLLLDQKFKNLAPILLHEAQCLAEGKEIEII